MEVGLVKKIDIDQEMQQSFLDYAMSVIVARALPDARDGLKPVHRRILYAMHDMGLRPNGGYRKSARIVGEVLGKYHPHGDVAVYEAMARMAQDFSMRYQLVDGQGNFGSVDGDPPAAMRYTEASLRPFAADLLLNLERDTVDFAPNFDGTLDEPQVLPSALPNLLLNGASGIAVGMATNIPPHNLSELLDAMNFMLENWEQMDEINVSDLMEYVKGPDFPTGGIILEEKGKTEIKSAYATGRGRITVRGRVKLEEMSRGRNRIIITELPYATNKASLIERIAELAREGKIEGVSDLRDESDRQGMRIVIDLTKNAEAENIIADLYKRTPLQSTFGITLLALVNEQPRLLTLKKALIVYLEHRIEVIRRRSEYDLRKAKQREHILAGLRIAINNLDEIINTIRRSQDVDQARERLMKKFKLSEIQANAILDMPLRRISSLERKKIETEYKDIVKTIKELESLLKSEKKIRAVVGEELNAYREKYADRRRTQIVSLENGESTKSLLTVTDMIPAEDVWVGVTADGKIARTQSKDLKRVSGKDAPNWVLKTNTHHTLYIVCESGEAISASVESLPVNEKISEGVPISNILPLGNNEIIAGIFSVPGKSEELENRFVFSVSRFGMVKKSALSDLPGPAARPFTLAKTNEGDSIVKLLVTDGELDVSLITGKGMMIRFSESEVRSMGLVAAGVNGIKLAEDDFVIGGDCLTETDEVLILSANGLGWHFTSENIPKQGRYGQGIIACKLKEGDEIIGLLVGKNTQQGILHYQKSASRLVRVDEIPVGRRNSAGKPAVPKKDDDALFAISPIWDGLKDW